VIKFILEVIMDRVEKAVELFKSGYNCSQAVIGAFCDEFGMDFETAMRVSEGFGGGMGRMRLTCGAVSGMFMLVGLKYSKAEGGDIETRTKIYETVQKLAKEFEEKNGSIVCGDLLGINKPKDDGAVPTTRSESFYKKRPCAKCVEDCAILVCDYLIND
jgi:C_GCAxxG_C_C family probable redox protein